MTFRILGIDPGGTTGWGSFTAEERYDPETKQAVYSGVKWDCGQIDKYEHHEELYAFLASQQTDHFTVVCESFEYRNSLPKAELISCEYIGVVKLFKRLTMDNYMGGAGQHLSMQTASQGKVRKTGFIKDRNLKRLGLWSPGNPHAMDGYGHILYYMIHTGKVMDHELLEKGWRG